MVWFSNSVSRLLRMQLPIYHREQQRRKLNGRGLGKMVFGLGSGGKLGGIEEVIEYILEIESVL